MPEAYFFSFLPNFKLKLGKKQKKYILFFVFFLILNFNLKLGKNEKKQKKRNFFLIYIFLPNFKLGKKVKKGEA